MGTLLHPPPVQEFRRTSGEREPFPVVKKIFGALVLVVIALLFGRLVIEDL